MLSLARLALVLFAARACAAPDSGAGGSSFRPDLEIKSSSTGSMRIAGDGNIEPKQRLCAEFAGYLSSFPSGSEVEFVVTVDSKNEIAEASEGNNTKLRFHPKTGAIIEGSRILITLP